MRFHPSMFPLAAIDDCGLDVLNECLVEWGHKMGPLNRGVTDYGCQSCVVLHQKGEALAVASANSLIRDHAGGGLDFITRENGCELSRVCAARPHICRPMVRLWRELVFPSLGFEYAVSYQDADMHSGNLYRHDGWTRSPRKSNSGTDSRTGKTGRSKWLWYWQKPKPPAPPILDLMEALKASLRKP